MNPAAGGGRAARAGQAVADTARRHWRGVEVVQTAGPLDATRLARAAAAVPVERVLVVGGDGTVHEAANGLLADGGRALPALGVIPVGTGNDFARLTGLDRMPPAEAVSRLARGTVARFDVGRAWGEYFVNSLGLGLDAAVAARVARGGTLRGWGAYAAALVGAWRDFRPARWEVTVGDEHWDEEHLLIEVGIGPASGGGFRLTPDARPDDGLLDVCAVRPIGLLRLLSIGPRVLWGGHRNAPEVRLRQTASLRVVVPRGHLLAHFDGEVRDPGRSTIDIVLEPRRLSVLLAS